MVIGLSLSIDENSMTARGFARYRADAVFEVGGVQYFYTTSAGLRFAAAHEKIG